MGLLSFSRPLLRILIAGALISGGQPSFSKDLEPGEHEKVKVMSLRPTQAVVGKKEVAARVTLLRQKMNQGHNALTDYLKDKRKLVVIGPGKQLYLVDGHHLASAALAAGLDEIYIEVAKDLSSLGTNAFWSRMAQSKLVYLKDAQGRPISPAALPTNVSRLADDPLRSLAWMLEQVDAIKKGNEPYFEFTWVDAMRPHVAPPLSDTKLEWRRALTTAWRFATSPTAKGLKGYRGASAPPLDFAKAGLNQSTK